MSFLSLVSEVYDVTNRPDLESETKLAVKAATLKAHQSDFYYKDLFETGIYFSSSEFNQQIELRTLIPRFRAMKYVRRYDQSGTGRAAEYYSILTPGELLDSYGNDRTNVAYMAGTELSIKGFVTFDRLLLGCYLNPDITEAGYNSWVALDHPYVIVFEAARLLFKQIGFDEQAAAFEKLAAEQFAELRINNIQAVGY